MLAFIRGTYVRLFVVVVVVIIVSSSAARNFSDSARASENHEKSSPRTQGTGMPVNALPTHRRFIRTNGAAEFQRLVFGFIDEPGRYTPARAERARPRLTTHKVVGGHARIVRLHLVMLTRYVVLTSVNLYRGLLPVMVAAAPTVAAAATTSPLGD